MMRSPGRYRSWRKTNGPEPTISVTFWSPAALTSRSGRMKGTAVLGRPSASRTRPKGCFSFSSKVRASITSSDAIAFASSRPIAARGCQRFSEATASAAVTGAPSWKARPSRSVKRQVRPSGETVASCTICGRISPFAAMPNSVS